MQREIKEAVTDPDPVQDLVPSDARAAEATVDVLLVAVVLPEATEVRLRLATTVRLEL